MRLLPQSTLESATRSNRVNRGELVAAVSPYRQQFRLHQPDVANDEPVLSGHFRVDCLREGLRTKCVDVIDLHDMCTEAIVGEGLNLVVLVAGQAHARFGGVPVTLGGNGRPDGALIALARNEHFVRHSQRGCHERKVVIAMSPSWLDATGFDCGDVAAFRRRHLGVQHWMPSTRATTIAQQMIHPPAFSPALQHLYLESRALELITESMADIFAAPAQTGGGTTPRVRARITSLCEWLDSGAADALDLAAIARHVGLNASSLQQQFHAVQGMSIFTYQRSRRLDAARTALAHDGISVAQAAELAGYSSPANFATAFRKRFGLSPSAAARMEHDSPPPANAP